MSMGSIHTQKAWTFAVSFDFLRFSTTLTIQNLRKSPRQQRERQRACTWIVIIREIVEISRNQVQLITPVFICTGTSLSTFLRFNAGKRHGLAQKGHNAPYPSYNIVAWIKRHCNLCECKGNAFFWILQELGTEKPIFPQISAKSTQKGTILWPFSSLKQ